MGKLFIEGNTSKKIGEIYNLTHQAIFYHIKNILDDKTYNKAVKLHRKKQHINNRKYSANYRYFKDIDHPHKAYWLGFLYGDGTIHQNRTLSIPITDLSLLKKFKKDINATHPIKLKRKKDDRSKLDCYMKNSIINGSVVFNKKDTYSINITNKKLIKDLNKFGVIQNKTLKINSVPNISEKYYPDFIRGVFDADGSVWTWINKDKYFLKKQQRYRIYEYDKIGFEILGNLRFINDIQNILIKIGFKKAKLFKKGKQTYYLRYCGKKNALRFYNYIYYNNNIQCLERKRNIFIDYFNIKKIQNIIT